MGSNDEETDHEIDLGNEETYEEQLEREKREAARFEEWKKNPPSKEELDRRVKATTKESMLREMGDERSRRRKLELKKARK